MYHGKPPASSAVIARRTRADMRASVREGLWAQACVNLAGPGSVFVTALALSLGAGGRALGFIFIAGPIMQGAQLLGPALLPFFRGSRKALVIASSAVSRGVIFLVPAFILLLPRPAALAALIVTFLVSQVFLGIASNVWTGWIGAIVPDRIRGRFLGKRLQLVTVFGLVAAFAASLVKDLATPAAPGGIAALIRRRLDAAAGLFGPGGERYAFALIFLAAGLFGVVSTLLLRRQGDRPAAAGSFSFRDLAVPWRDARFRPLLYFFGGWFFAIYFGSPFWQPFFIEELGMSLTAIQFYGLIFTVAMAGTAAATGRAIDRFGNKPVFRAMMLLSVFNAFVYVFMRRDLYWWIWIEALTSGVMWGGASVATTNLIIRLSPGDRRDAYVAVYAIVTGACGLVSTLLSGQLVAMLPHYVVLGGLPLVNMKIAFLGTAGLRVLAQLPMYLVREPRAAAFRTMMRATAADARLWFVRWFPGFRK